MSTYIRYPATLATGALAIGDSVTSGTSGSVLYVDASSQLAQDNANFFWDATNHRLGIGTTGPSVALHVVGSARITGLSTAGLAHNDANGVLSTSLLVNADVDAAAAIAYSKLALTGSIVNTDIGASAAIAYSKLALTGAIVNADISASAAIAYSKLSLGTSIVNADVSASAAIAYSKLALTGTIVNADVGASAAIAYSKLASLSTGQVLAGNAGTPTATTLGGDATIGATGTLTIANSAITNAKVSASAAIDFSKLAALTSAHILVGSGSNVATDTAVTGDVTISNAGVTAIGSAKVTNTMLAGSIDLTTKVTGTLPIANGGTNNGSLAVTAGGVVYTDGSKLVNTGVGTSGQFLKSNAGSAPAFTSFTAPTVQKFTSGSGTYTTAAGVLWIRVRMSGGGGGGSGSSTVAGADGATGGTGGNSTFGSSLLTANGGVGGQGAGGTGKGGAGGSASLGTGPVGLAISGAAGGPINGGATSERVGGGWSGTNTLGGGGVAGAGGGGNTGGDGVANTGAGGSGGSGPNAGYSGSGGGSGGYVDAIITAPSATYSYAVGAAGTAGTAGTGGFAGGAGAAGIVIVEEFYQ